MGVVKVPLICCGRIGTGVHLLGEWPHCPPSKAGWMAPSFHPKVGEAHPALPVRKYDSDPTHGIFNDKKSLMSGSGGGEALEVFSNQIQHLTEHALVSLKHVEGHAAAEMAKNGLTEAVVHINFKTGPCRHCCLGIQELLSEGQKLWVVLPDGVGYFTNKGWTPK